MAVKKPQAAGVPPKEALEYFKGKGLKPAFSYRDVWKEEHRYAFTVAKVLEKDLLKDVRDSITKALAEGIPFEQWKQEVKPTLDQSGWAAYGTERTEPFRLKIIYQTNMRVARAAGQWERAQKTKAALPNFEYNLGPSEHHRPEHEAWDGLVLPIDDPFWDEHNPPNGWGCKCWLRQIGRRETDDLGGLSEAPETNYVDWTNPSTGQTEQVPEGVDPGWDYNPGVDRQQGLDDAETE